MRIQACPLVVALLAVVSFLPAAPGQQPQTVNVRPRSATTTPGVPEVNVTVDRRRVPLGDEVTFTLAPASVVLNPSYVVTLYYGDGTSQRMRQAEIVHLYRAPGNYTYSVLVTSSGRPEDNAVNSKVPDVKLSATPTTVSPAGLVNFDAQLAYQDPNIKYHFVFGDKSESGWQSSSETTHSYSSADAYEAFVEIGVTKNEPLKHSNRVKIQVTRSQESSIGPASLTANPKSVEPGRPVTLNASVASKDPNIRYRFSFGDKSPPINWQASSQTTHKYSSGGTYWAQVDIGLMNKGFVEPTGTNAQQQIEVKTAQPLSVSLSGNPTSVDERGSVLFRAKVDSADPNIGYRFDFGDRSGSTWQSSPQTKHAYSSEGNYSAHVDVRVTNNQSAPQTARSNSVAIEVKSSSSRALDLVVTPPSVAAGLPVLFNAKLGSANAKTRYRFNFGDGSPPSEWTDTPAAPHIYSLAGDYPAFVQVGSSSNTPITPVASSSTKQVNVTPVLPRSTVTPTQSPVVTPTSSSSVSPSPLPSVTISPTPASGTSPIVVGRAPSPNAGSPSAAPPFIQGLADDWWKYLIIAAIVIFGGYQAAKFFAPPPRPTFHPHVDPGTSEVEAESGPLGIDFQLHLNPNVGEGEYRLDTDEASLIKSERSNDD